MLGLIITFVSGLVIGIGTPSKSGLRGEWSSQMITFGFLLSLFGIYLAYSSYGSVGIFYGLGIAIATSGIINGLKS